MPGGVDGLAGGGLGHVDDASRPGRRSAAAMMPERSRIHSSRGVDRVDDLGVGHDALGPVAADAEDAGVRGAGREVDRVPRSGRCRHGLEASVEGDGRPGCRSRRARRSASPWLGPAVLADHAVGRSRSSGVFTRGPRRRAGALGEAGEGAGRGELDEPGDAEVGERAPCTGPSAPGCCTWRDEPVEHLAAARRRRAPSRLESSGMRGSCVEIGPGVAVERRRPRAPCARCGRRRRPAAG